MLFIILSNYFRILSPQISGYVIDAVAAHLEPASHHATIAKEKHYDFFVQQFISITAASKTSIQSLVVLCGLSLLILAILGGFFMFLMRQTIIVMSRHIEFDQKNAIFNHYQKLDTQFYKSTATGDLMNRISEDVSRVRMYTGPTIMYFINLAGTIGFSVFFMVKENAMLTFYVLTPLPFLAITIYYVNNIIHKKSELTQSLLSDLTTIAQQSYSGIRVIQSYVQEDANGKFFNDKSEDYKNNAIGLAKVEALYFPSIALLIGLSTLITVGIGGWYYVKGIYGVTAGTITEFVIYVNMLTFPVSAIGLTASMMQRASASQKRINEFLHTIPNIKEDVSAVSKTIVNTDIRFENMNFVYANTGIHALKNFNLTIKQEEKVLVIGKTGSGKTTLAQLLLRFYDTTSGNIYLGDIALKDYPLKQLRQQFSYVPQDVFLFSDTIENNIDFLTTDKVDKSAIISATTKSSIHKEIMEFEHQYKTLVGERGVTLSGGQKQRISIARAILKDAPVLILDDCLSAVDANTEREIASQLAAYLEHKTAIIISHRILSSFHFDKIIVLDEGEIIEEGTHDELLKLDGYYSLIFKLQQNYN